MTFIEKKRYVSPTSSPGRVKKREERKDPETEVDVSPVRSKDGIRPENEVVVCTQKVLRRSLNILSNNLVPRVFELNPNVSMRKWPGDEVV